MNQSLDVVLVTHEFPPERGGAGVYCQELAEGAHKIGISIELLAPKGSVTNNNCKTTTLPWAGSQSWKSSIQLFLFLRKFLNKTDKKVIIHIADPGVCVALIRFSFLFPRETQFMVTIHGSELLKFTRNPVKRFFFYIFLSKCSIVHLLSKFNYENCIKLFPSTKAKLKVIRGAPSRVVKLEPYSCLKKNRLHNLVLLCVGRIHPRKGQYELIKAASALPQEIASKLKLVFVGPIGSQSYFSKITKEYQKFKGQIDFKGDLPLNDLRACYLNADIFCLCPTVQKKSVEGFGFVYLEASSFGLPILATRTGGVEDAVIEGKTGLIADPNKPGELIEKLLSLVEDKVLRKKLGENGKLWAKQHSWENIARKLYLEN